MATPQAMVELDFLGVQKETASAPQNFDRRRNFRGIQSAISKINPQLVKNVIASASADAALPLSAPPTFRAKTETAEETAPITIFHNGTVTVCDVTKDQAESILKMTMAMAMAVSSKNVETDKVVSSTPLSYQGDVLQEGLPHTRRKSLERFFEKRKERLMSVFPYEIPKPKDNAVAGAGAGGQRATRVRY